MRHLLSIVKYRFSDIQEVEYYCRNLSEEEQKHFDRRKLNVGFSLNVGGDLSQDKLDIGLRIIYKGTIQKVESEILKLDLLTVFQLKDYETKVSQNEDRSINIDDNLLISLLRIIIGTARGIIYTKTRGTFLNQFYLPIINVKALLDKIMLVEEDPHLQSKKIKRVS